MACRLVGAKPLSEPMLEYIVTWTPVASFTMEVNSRLAKRPLKTNGRWANLELTSLVKEATGNKLKWNLNKNLYIFIQQNAFEDVVWKMVVILYRLQTVNLCWQKKMPGTARVGGRRQSTSGWRQLTSFICTQLRHFLAGPYVDFAARSRYLREGWVITSHSLLWGVITYPCLRYLFLAPKSS